eukprot:TRINITY_DN531_c0_g1_i1.p1 TRINITY_DN531_c0_g1~~TRINITY_DN531_c0_g1_i1.p1  ORF type:complete len:290 (-),score=95.04 TRINITY_DN531_c0_g1_i1:146-1015(-)
MCVRLSICAMKYSSAAFLALLALQPAQALLRAAGSSLRSTVATDALVAEASRMEAEDARFFSSEWSSLEDELHRLAAIAQPANASTPAVNASAPGGHRKPVIPKHMNLNPKSVADLIPQLAMLKGLYDDGKERIAKLNEREKDNKKKYEEKEVAHKAKLAKIEARFANHTLSLEFRTNETRDENKFWKYWERCRERQHSQFRTGLRIQHATLEKVKKMIDMYEKTISGDTKKVAEAKKELKKVAPPEIVFLETQHSVAEFCSEAIEELHGALQELRNLAPVATSSRPML